LPTIDENAETLSKFGLTHNQAKVYIAIAQLGLASVNQASKVSKVRREDIYRMLPKLEEIGLVEKILGKPAKIKATPIEEGLSILIKREQDIVSKKMSALMAEKDVLLKNFKANKMKPTLEGEEARFALILNMEARITKGQDMAKNAMQEIDIITSQNKFTQAFTEYDETLKASLKRGAKIHVILDLTEDPGSILKIIEEYRSSNLTFDLKCTDEPTSHIMIVDHKEALLATSRESPIGANPYLWTDDTNFIGILQKHFENLWHTSINLQTIETYAVAEKMMPFVRQLRPTNHVLFLYESPEAKYNVLFNYLKVGLENGEATVYIATEEHPNQIREAMKRFGIDAEKNEKKGSLRILGCSDIYIVDGKFNIPTTMGLLNKLYNEALTKGFKGWRVAGEMACFFEHNLIQDLIEYEKSGHRVFDIPIIGICAYNANVLTKTQNPINIYTELIKAHGTVLFTGIDNKLGKIEIRK